MKRLLAVITLIAAINVYANQQTVKISPGFFTAKDYLDMNETERRAYVTGQINGMLLAPFFGAPEDNLSWLKTCSSKMSDEEVAGIVSRYVRDHANQMNFSLNVVTFNALRQSCRK